MPEWVAIIGCFVGGVVVGEFLGCGITFGMMKYHEHQSNKKEEKTSDLEA